MRSEMETSWGAFSVVCTSCRPDKHTKPSVAREIKSQEESKIIEGISYFCNRMPFLHARDKDRAKPRLGDNLPAQ